MGHEAHDAHDMSFNLYWVTYCVFVVAALETNMSERATSFPTVERFRSTKSISTAIRKAAARDTMTSSEYMRQAIIRKLRVDGIDPGQIIEASK